MRSDIGKPAPGRVDTLLSEEVIFTVLFALLERNKKLSWPPRYRRPFCESLRFGCSPFLSDIRFSSIYFRLYFLQIQ